jgi:predicted fused transcriptional regulator/phosphomethylpyrimidine kinase
MSTAPILAPVQIRVDTTAATEAIARLRENFAGMAPTAAAAAEVLAVSGRAIQESLGITDSSSPDTSQPYFLDLLRRIDDATR